jgi:hypothetical protein
MNVIDLHPMPTSLVGRISRENWIATAPVLRDEIVRAWEELSAGKAIGQDVRCGRPKRATGDSFFALHQLEMEHWRRPDAKLAAQIDELGKRLAPDLERMMAKDDMEEFHDMARRRGTTLPVLLREWVSLEITLRRDIEKGIEMLANKLGVDLRDVAAQALEAQPDSVA